MDEKNLRASKSLELWTMDELMRRRILIILLYALLMPSLGFGGIRSSAAQEELVVHKSVAWGFECLGAPRIIQTPFSYSYSTAQKASKLLGQYGYDTDLQKNPVEERLVQSSFKNAEVFFYIGHAVPDRLVLTDENCKPIRAFAGDYLEGRGEDDRKLKFVLLAACRTAEGDDNILKAFDDTEAIKVIGFEKDVQMLATQYWSDRFWKYALQDKMEVSDAANKAIKDVEFWHLAGITGLNSVKILGTDPVYLGYPQEPPSFDEGWGQYLGHLWESLRNQFENLYDPIVEDLSELWDGLGDFFQRQYWEEQWANIQKSIERWFQQQTSDLLEQLLVALENFIVETCLQPFVAVLIFTGAFLYRKRHYQ